MMKPDLNFWGPQNYSKRGMVDAFKEREMSKFHVKKSSNNQFYWTFVASNGETLVTSETYTTKQNAKHAIEVVQKEAANAQISDDTLTSRADLLGY